MDERRRRHSKNIKNNKNKNEGGSWRMLARILLLLLFVDISDCLDVMVELSLEVLELVSLR